MKSKARDLGLLALRVGVGATLAAHGTQKLLGWFDGPGLENTATGFEAMGFRPGKVNALAAGITETAGGLLLAAGLATPVAGAATAGTMVVASAIHGPQGFFAQKGGYEYAAMLGLAATSLVLTGPGRVSLDQLTRNRLNGPWLRAISVAAIAPAAIVVVSQRNRALAAARAAEAETKRDGDAPDSPID